MNETSTQARVIRCDHTFHQLVISSHQSTMDTQSNNINGTSYTLKQIADWQLKGTSGDVILPDLQRGFVWKPFQTEDFWDSVLRRFPVGTFILAPSQKNDVARLELLDGQQRATAIAFGFFDPWVADSAHDGLWRIRNAADIPILWLDLLPPDNNAEIRFVFRLLTRSQPWGYERRDNQTPLTAIDRRKFLSRLSESLPPDDRGKRYLELPLTHFWPWDAKLPVPFAFLLKSIRDDDWKCRLTSLCTRHFPTLKTKHPSSGTYTKRLEEFLARPAADMLRIRIANIIESTQVPVLKIASEVFEDSKGTSVPRSTKRDEEEEVPDEIETLFVRINSAGTPLAGEELIYSIYKSILPETIDLVERVGGTFIVPSRLISLANRIVQADMQREGQPRQRKSKTDGISLPAKVRVKDFRGLIYSFRSRFKERLRTFISSLAENDIFRKAQDILSGSERFQLPSALAVDIARRSPEILFILIYRLHLGDHVAIGSEAHRKVLGFLTALSWFGRGEKLKDHDPCLRHVWRELLTSERNAFWRRSVLTRTIEPRNDQLVMLPLLPPGRLSKYLQEWVITKGKAWDDLEDPSGNSYIAQWYRAYYKSHATKSIAIDAWWEFLDKLGTQRGLVLYAQREFVNRWFSNFNHAGVQNLEDTNCPWDWDHIHAQRLIKRKWNVDTALREWHSTIGNLRIWPMELNRSDSDLPPSEKLAPEADSNPFLEKYELESSAKILHASFIGDKEPFADIDGECDIKKKSATRMIRRAILMRMLSLYRHWFDELRLAEYFPQ